MTFFANRQLLMALIIGCGSPIAFAGCGDDDNGGDGPEAGAPHTEGGRGGSTSHGGGEQGGTPHAEGGAPHGEGSPECEAIGSLCHAGDSGPGPISDCHDTGHAGDPEVCRDAFADCINLCVVAESGAGGDAGAPAVVDNPYCQALGAFCHFVDDVGTATGECHEVGHAGDEPACIETFAACIPICHEKREAEEAAAGGAGGGPGTHTEGGAANNGGAGG